MDFRSVDNKYRQQESKDLFNFTEKCMLYVNAKVCGSRISMEVLFTEYA